MVTVGGAGSVFGPGGLILLQHREHRHCFFSDMSDGFDRAPGAGRSRGRGVLGSGLGRGRSRGQEAVESGKIPGFRAQSGGEANSAPHKAGGRQQQGPLRPPRTSPSVISETAADQTSQRTSPSLVQIPVQNNSMAGSKSQSAESTPVSSLSVDAAEFYPPGYVIDHNNVDQNGDYPGVPQESFAEFVQQFLNYLTEQPGSFEVEIYNFLEVLNNSVTTDCLQELVELVYQQSTSVPNFSYTGARICNFLSINLHINSQNGNFRQILLQRCHTEYEKRDQGAKGDQATRKRFHAFVLFLGELYLKLEVKGSNGQLTKAEVLQSGLRELLSALFSNPVDDNLICAVKLLKVKIVLDCK
ncbi:polyadenylate-binding protein-interacting protein 1 [Bombina bombina]|uniref:polyadenylate-binding protein-interacting protein 1 n=1 Tax=Bombina bombina TaxID=8345 RepID=UPI00235B2F9F|nr:polyadenylate-binding protein-interacting protein 1 [Bombina bombina]